jgi:hypothetical protein
MRGKSHGRLKHAATAEARQQNQVMNPTVERAIIQVPIGGGRAAIGRPSAAARHRHGPAAGGRQTQDLTAARAA